MSSVTMFKTIKDIEIDLTFTRCIKMYLRDSINRREDYIKYHGKKKAFFTDHGTEKRQITYHGVRPNHGSRLKKIDYHGSRYEKKPYHGITATYGGPHIRFLILRSLPDEIITPLQLS